MRDVRSTALVEQCRWQYVRIRRKLSQATHQCFGWESGAQLGYHGPELLQKCLAESADLYSVHSPMGLSVGANLIRRGRLVSVDIEDWHSEDLREEDRSDLPLNMLKGLEATVLRQCAFSSTTSHALSDSLAYVYQCKSPIVLYNAFSRSERAAKLPSHLNWISGAECKRVGWVSQVIGPDRGLEQLVAATHYLKRPIEIHLTGRLRSGMEDLLRSGLHSASRIVFQDQVPHEELLALMQTFDIGFAGELAHNKSRDLTVTNKVLHYFLAGIPAVCSDTQGQLEICRKAPEATRVYAQRDPAALAAAIDSLVECPERLRQAKHAAWQAGTTTFCWEENESQLIQAVREATSGP